MTISISGRRLLVASAVGVALAVAVGGVSYAAGTSTAHVSACSNSKSRLALQSSKGTCPKGFKKVTIANQGPRGAQGAKGATGDRGPGAVVYDDIVIGGSGSGKTVTVGNYRYTGGCQVTGTGSSREIEASFSVSLVDGGNVSLDGVLASGDGSGPVDVSSITTSSQPTEDFAVLSSGGKLHQEWIDGARAIGDDGTEQVINLRMTASPAIFNNVALPCSWRGVITPGS